MNTKTNQTETHPLFPSGDWEGFYTYIMGQSGDQHRMQFQLNFNSGKITGGGSDDVGGFVWRGTYEKQNYTCNITKHYPTHTVHYTGHADENGIWGTWSLSYMKGGFHIWPKNNTREEAEKEVASKSLPY